MANSVPTLAGLNPPTFLENTVNATPQLIDANVTLADREGNVASGTLTITGLLPEDVISIRNQGVIDKEETVMVIEADNRIPRTGPIIRRSTISRVLAFAGLATAVLLSPATAPEANAQNVVTVPRECKTRICARTEYWGGRVRLFWSGSPLSRSTHYNFRTNPGGQIERPGNYSFEQRPGKSGTYSVQACNRGGIGARSTCSQWVTFNWRS